MKKDIIDRNALLTQSWMALMPDGSSVSVVSLDTICGAPSLGQIHSEALLVVLSKQELELVKESLDFRGDQVADCEGYASGEEYWDLKDKLANLIPADPSPSQPLDQAISDAKARAQPTAHPPNTPREPEF